jgi:hypothetical protein
MSTPFYTCLYYNIKREFVKRENILKRIKSAHGRKN